VLIRYVASWLRRNGKRVKATFSVGLYGEKEAFRLAHNRLQILIRDRLDNIPIFIEHLNVAKSRTRALLSIIERVLATCFTAEYRLHAFSFEHFPAALVLPLRIS